MEIQATDQTGVVNFHSQSAFCIKQIFEFFDMDLSYERLYEMVYHISKERFTSDLPFISFYKLIQDLGFEVQGCQYSLDFEVQKCSCYFLFFRSGQFFPLQSRQNENWVLKTKSGDPLSIQSTDLGKFWDGYTVSIKKGPRTESFLIRIKEKLDPVLQVKLRELKKRYQAELVGKGGYAFIFKGSFSGIPVAIKIIPNYLLHIHKKTLKTFLQELQIYRKLSKDHPTTVMQLFAIDEEHRFIVTKWASMRTLVDQMHLLKSDQANRVLFEVATHIRNLHSIGFIHRDLKPENILIDETGSTKLTDFGLAQSYEHIEKTIKSDGNGTKKYMAPEQLNLQKLGPPCDVYSLGLIYLEMLLGIISMHDIEPLKQNPKGFLEKHQILSSTQLNIILGMLEKDPEKRTNIEMVIEKSEELINCIPI